MTLVGDVAGKIAILVDDMADTCGTLVKAADVLMASGAKEVVAIVTHGILSGTACEKINGSQLSRVVVTNTVPHAEKKKGCPKLETIDIAPTVRPPAYTHILFPPKLSTLTRVDTIASGSMSKDTQRRERIVLILPRASLD